MKFAKELEQELVPEWRAKYLDYKLGKKKIKAIARALRALEQAPRTPGRRGFILSGNDSHTPRIGRPGLLQLVSYRGTQSKGPSDNCRSNEEGDAQQITSYFQPHVAVLPETRPLKSPTSRFADHTAGYGSIVTPKSHATRSTGLPSLELPDPALDPNETSFPPCSQMFSGGSLSSGETPTAGRGRGQNGNIPPSILPGPRNVFRPRSGSLPVRPRARKGSFLQRIFTSMDHESPAADPPAEAFFELRNRENEFFYFLDSELAKIESFYRLKEEEATDRLGMLKQQLHVMRDMRLEELRAKARSRHQRTSTGTANNDNNDSSAAARWKKPLSRSLTTSSKFAKISKEMDELPTPGSTLHRSHGPEGYRDFVRSQERDVPYRSAKGKLKVALLEFYRGLELLKAYAYLNRKAFRKMNKKYDKVTNARPTGRYMSEKVNKAWFVQSDLVENHLVAVEDLYTRYFERGNRKVAVTKLRGKTRRSQDYSPNSFRNGLLFSAGLVFGIQGLVHAVGHLFNNDDDDDDFDDIRVRTSYLLQIYGGYTLILLHFIFFCLNCRIWTLSKINYVFVFEYDTRHVLDWRQLAEIPCFLVCLLGLVIWLNFGWVNEMYIYWPIVLIGLTIIILFIPAPILYHRSRKWWAYSNWRLMLAGLYPVEFRDFFLGDMYCSQTYAMGNLALFLCLYSAGWSDPAHCNSSHSRAMGFLTTVPSIWRALQCLRRYRDTRNWFPHIVNLGKYSFSIMYYMTLSLYRVNKVESLRATFIAFALVNAIYSSIWDVAMDWSLGNPFSKNPLLRDFLGFRKRWIYYAAMVVDPILRFNWIFYAIFTHDLQHSAILSFIVSLSEVCRRGIWSILRVENEHCTNVCRFRASRDVPLPYDIPTQASVEHMQQPNAAQQRVDGSPIARVPSTRPATGTDVERLGADGLTGVRRRRGSHRSEMHVPSGTLARMGSILANAHAEDFERRKRPGVVGSALDHDAEQVPADETGRGPDVHRRDSSTDEEEEEDEESASEENDINALDDPCRTSMRSGSMFDDNDDDDNGGLRN
ncbi:hypothetical protein DIZ76_013380 [Coccidioides immitis]|nr:hypothetical protein DIZ76_013380 [Coccidioides immitis]